ncbi:hypothetical protein [Flavobacterium chungangense]|uniref:Lipoprotein n=1 Tax=Flavobacterium chungangense TaxID=554283 RepID=A0A6V6YSV6_9FLAO|nr:hypothetical protein [Flavobacterium chungangense]CAD0002496.1 hypothetical protein FLACHUCJ7_00991 [Flavobacterium chungangense]
MKKVFIYIFIIWFTQSCKSQDKKNSTNNNDVRIFNFTDKNVFAKSEYLTIDGKLLLNQEKSINPSPKTYTFYQNKDTMSIKCFCNYENNILLDSIDFIKGKYKINIIKILRKKQPQKLHKILNADLYKNYRNLFFYRISLKDTTKIKLEKI